MERRKVNKSPLIRLGLIAVLMLGCLVTAIGPAQARYKVSDRATAELGIRPLEQIYLGQMVKASADSEEEVFDETRKGVWQMVDGRVQLEFVVANGVIEQRKDPKTGEMYSAEVFAQEDQRALIQLVGDLSVWDGKQKFSVELIAPSRVKRGETEVYTAVPQRIDPDSPLYKTFGDGWIFTFVDKDGQELTWLLEGGKLSAVEYVVVLDGISTDQVGHLMLKVTGDYTKK